MGIIGVVAALTLPNLNSSTGEKEKVVRVKKFYSDFSDAFGRATAVYGPVYEWFQNDSSNAEKSKRFAERLADFLKISKNCQTGTGCFASGKQKKLRGGDSTNEYNSDTSFYKFVLADGMSVGFGVGTMSSEDTYLPISVGIDIDGPNQGANTLGKDVFFIYGISEDGTLLSGSDDLVDVAVNCFSDGLECTGWIMQTGNMDYLKADSSGKCPDGKTILDGVSNITCK